MRRALVILFLLIIGLPVFSDSSAVILNENVDYLITNGKVRKTVTQTVKINTPAAYRTFGEWFFVYNPDVTNVKIVKSETVQPDGTIVNTPENGIVLQSPYSTDNSPEFSFMREIMVSHTGLEPGCIIKFEYVVEDLKPFRTVIYEPFNNYFPIVEKTVSFNGIDDASIFVNGNIQKSGNSYGLKQISPVLRGHYFSTEDTCFIAVTLSNPFKKISHIFSEESKLSGIDSVMSEMNLSSKSTSVEVVSKLSDFIQERLETIHLPLEESGWYVRDISSIMNSGYVSDIEKALLCVSVLNSYGYSPICKLSSELNGFLINPGFSVDCSDLSVFDSLGESNSIFTLDGVLVEKSSEIAVSVAIQLEEQNEGKFTGYAYLDTQEFSGSLSSLIFLGKIKDTDILLKSEHSKKGSYDLEAEVKEDCLNIINVFDDTLHVGRILDDMLYGNSITINETWDITFSLSVEFLDNRDMAFTKAFSISNEYGSSQWKWSQNGCMLKLDAGLKLKKGGIPENDYDKVINIIAPLLNQQNTKVLF